MVILTAKQQEVAELVADGLSNKKIAVRLDRSPRTIEKHVEAIANKIGRRPPRLAIMSWYYRQHGRPAAK